MRWSRTSALWFALLGILVLAGLNIAARMPVSGPTEPQVMKSRFDRIAGKDAVSLGGSTATAISFETMCVDGTRFWNNGQDMFEGEALIDLILSRPDPPRLYFLVIGPGTLIQDNGLPTQAATFRRRFTYRFLQSEGRWGLIGGDWRQAILAQAMPAIGHELRDPWRIAILDVLGRLPPPSAEIDHDTGSISPADASALGKAQFATWRQNEQDTVYFDPHVAWRTRAALLRTATKIEQAGGQLIIVSPPYIDELTGPMEKAEWARTDYFRSVLSEAEQRGAIAIDLWDNHDTRYGPEYFRDAMHLNAPGARRFSERIEENLRGRGIVQSRDCK